MEMEQIWMWLFWIVRGVYTKGVLCLNLNMVVESKDFHFKYLYCLFVQLSFLILSFYIGNLNMIVESIAVPALEFFFFLKMVTKKFKLYKI